MEAPHDRQERAGRGSELESRPGTHTRVPRRSRGKWCAGQQMAAWPRVWRGKQKPRVAARQRAYTTQFLVCRVCTQCAAITCDDRELSEVRRLWWRWSSLAVPGQDVGCKECGSLTLTIGPVLKRHLTATYPNRDESRPPIGQSATPENSASTLTANGKSGEGEQKTPWKEFSFGKFITHTPTRHRRQGSVHRCCCRYIT